MTKTTSKSAHLNNPKTGPTQKPQKPRGRKPKNPAPKRRRTPPGRGGLLLRSSINALVGEESDRIAQALIDKTVAGNMVSARLLVELSGADKLPPPGKKKRTGPSLTELLASEPEWTEADEARLNHDASKLGPSEPDWDDPDSVAEYEALNARTYPPAS